MEIQCWRVDLDKRFRPTQSTRCLWSARDGDANQCSRCARQLRELDRLVGKSMALRRGNSEYKLGDRFQSQRSLEIQRGPMDLGERRKRLLPGRNIWDAGNWRTEQYARRSLRLRSLGRPRWKFLALRRLGIGY